MGVELSERRDSKTDGQICPDLGLRGPGACPLSPLARFLYSRLAGRGCGGKKRLSSARNLFWG